MNRINAGIMAQIEKLCREGGLTLDQLTEELKEVREKKEYEQILACVEDSRKLVGHCFKGRDLEGAIFKGGVKPVLGKKTIFYKVVSERAERIGEVECIVFSQTPGISFRAERHLLWQPSDGIVGHYCYSGIHNCSVSKHDIECLTGITNEEFETAAKEHLSLLLEADWQAVAGSYEVRRFGDE